MQLVRVLMVIMEHVACLLVQLECVHLRITFFPI